MSDDTGKDTDITGKNGGESGITLDTEPGIEGFKPFEKKVTIKIPVYDRGVEGLPPVDDNYWTKWIQKNFGDKYNITVNYEPIPRSDVMTKYSLLIAARKHLLF